jgi:hypothetical protein
VGRTLRWLALLLGNWATIVFREVKAEQRYDFADTIAMFSELIREFPRGHKDMTWLPGYACCLRNSDSIFEYIEKII